VLAVVLVLAGIGEFIALRSPLSGSDPAGGIFLLVFAALPASLVGVGAFVAWRQPRNSIGWIFLLAGSFAALGIFPGALARANVGTPELIAWGAWLGSWAFLPGIGLLVAVLPLVFPTGSLLSPRWRVVLAIDAAGMTLAILGIALSPGPLEGTSIPIDNPAAIHGIGGLLDVAGVTNSVLTPVAFAAGIVALVIRFRRARGAERQQFKWFFFVALVTAGCFLLSFPNFPVISDVAWIAGLVSLIFLPVSVGVAILRYRLYDIDLLINRTVVYGGVTAVLAVGIWVANVAIQRSIESMTGQRSDMVTAGLGVGAGLLFGPMRRWVRPAVDRLLPSRAELALLFTDIVGSTEALVEMGDVRWRTVLSRYLAAVRAELGRFGGHEVNTAGDAFFATFHRAGSAVEAAWAMRDAVRVLGLETRTGIHLGEVEMRGEQVSGLAVHTAARVMASAEPGEVLVSDAVRDAIAADMIRLDDRGMHALKGVPGEWQLFAAEAGSGGEAG
jgi:class 3 adenylate cyclase